VRARIAPVVVSFAEGNTFASASEQHIRASARHIFFQFASIASNTFERQRDTFSYNLRSSASNTLKKRNVFLHILLIHERQRVTHSSVSETHFLQITNE
jgi:hypothetical protein